MAFCPHDGHALVSAPTSSVSTDPLLHTQVSEYVLQERIGAGGMGIVYRAVQPLIGKQVAIKILKEEYAGAQELVERLLVEARAVNAIQHRGIIDIFGFGQLADGRPYMVMELLHGLSLSAYLRKRRKLGAEEAAELLDEMLAALGAAHRAGVIHRDLKPGNVFLVERAEGGRAVKLLDFGIAKVAESRASRPLTRKGNLLGTPEYMPPEQVRGDKLDPTADLYAVGVMAFQMLTGKLPFTGDSMRILMAQVNERPPTLSSLAPEVPAELEALVLRLLAKEPSKRPATAEAVRRELSGFVSRRSGVSKELTPLPSADASSAPTRELGKTRAASQGARTLEVPMLAGATADGATPVQTEPITDVTLTRPTRARWLMGVGAAALVLSAGVVGAKVLQRPSPAPRQVTQPDRPGVLAPEGGAVAPRPEAAVQVARAEVPKEASPTLVAPPKEASPPPVAALAVKEASLPPAAPPKASTAAPKAQRSAVAKAAAPKPPPAAPAVVKVAAIKPPPAPPTVEKATASKPPPEASADPAVCPNTKIDQKTLMTLLKEAEVRLQKADPKVCPATTSLIRLREIQKEASVATTDEQRVKIAAKLGEWEKEFLPKR
jgi:serine/threonine-protein kinase